MVTGEINKQVNHPVWSFWPTFGFGLWVMTVGFTVQFLVMVIIILQQISSGAISLDQEYFQSLSNNGMVLSLATIFSAVACVALIIFIVKLKTGSDIREYLGVKGIGVKAALVALGITIVYIVMVQTLAEYIHYEGSTFMQDAYNTAGWQPLFWLMAVVFAPLFEETFFRGFMFEGFRRSRIGIIGALLLTSLLWAALHVQYGLFEISSIFFLGIILGLSRHLSGSLWVPMLIHALFNLTSMIAMALTGK